MPPFAPPSSPSSTPSRYPRSHCPPYVPCQRGSGCVPCRGMSLRVGVCVYVHATRKCVYVHATRKSPRVAVHLWGLCLSFNCDAHSWGIERSRLMKVAWARTAHRRGRRRDLHASLRESRLALRGREHGVEIDDLRAPHAGSHRHTRQTVTRQGKQRDAPDSRCLSSCQAILLLHLHNNGNGNFAFA
eukprot:3805565-Rhodomonas_salina.2